MRPRNLRSKSSYHRQYDTITVVADFEGLAEEACQVSEVHKQEHLHQAGEASQGVEAVGPASRDEGEPEVPSSSVQAVEGPWASAQTAAGTEAVDHLAWADQIALAASAEVDPAPSEADPALDTPASGQAVASRAPLPDTKPAAPRAAAGARSAAASSPERDHRLLERDRRVRAEPGQLEQQGFPFRRRGRCQGRPMRRN